MTTKTKSPDARSGLVQAKISHREVISRRLVERVEWIPRDIKVGATVQVDGDTRYRRVVEICSGPVNAG
jgi:hypothetical protein